MVAAMITCAWLAHRLNRKMSAASEAARQRKSMEPQEERALHTLLGGVERAAALCALPQRLKG